MSDRAKVITESLGGSALARAAMAGGLPQWFGERPSSAEEWSARCTRVGESAPRGWLDPLRAAFGAGIADTAAGQRLARAAASPRGVVVTTGQQPGLFGGPIYTWSKALSALALADELERSCGVPVAPVFWAATDDADFAEASRTAVLGPDGLEVLAIAATTGEALPMSRVPLGPDVAAAALALARAAGSAASRDVLDVAARAYVPGATVGDAFVILLRALLEPLGIAVLDASHRAVRAAAHPVLVRALRDAATIEQRVAERVRAIEGAGFQAQVPHVAGLSLVFNEDERGKARVSVSGAAKVAQESAVGALGPNVLLRPVVERALLPTVAYLGGPGEIAYFAQVSAVADAIGVDVPLVLPRWSSTLLEPQVERVLARLGLEIGDLADPHAVETRLARSALPARLSEALAEFRADIRRDTARLAAGDDSASASLLPATVLEGLERALLFRMDRVERRAVAAQKKRSAAILRDVARARGALFPLGTRQERALNLLPLLARHGPRLLADMREAAGAHAAMLVGHAGRSPVLATGNGSDDVTS